MGGSCSLLYLENSIEYGPAYLDRIIATSNSAAGSRRFAPPSIGVSKHDLGGGRRKLGSFGDEAIYVGCGGPVKAWRKRKSLTTVETYLLGL